MIAVIGIGDREPLEHAELRFDQVKPGSLSGSPDWMDVQFLQQSQEFRVVMDIVKVVEHHEKTLPRVTFAQSAERLADFLDTTAGTEDAVQVIVVDIVKPEEVLDAVGTAIGSPHA
jgi:hypothetical protein